MNRTVPSSMATIEAVKVIQAIWIQDSRKKRRLGPVLPVGLGGAGLAGAGGLAGTGGVAVTAVEAGATGVSGVGLGSDMAKSFHSRKTQSRSQNGPLVPKFMGT